MKRLYVNIETIITSNDNEILFEKNVIHNLYRINQQLNYQLIIVSDEKSNAEKFIKILKNESIAFTLQTKVDKNENNLYINKANLTNWDNVYKNLKSSLRKITHTRNTNETKIDIELKLEGEGIYHVSTGLGFFNHMLEQFSRHSLIDLTLNVRGDLQIDEHHTIEDTAIALGEAMLLALGNKKGMERYGFLLPMDDCLAQVAIDFGGRSWLVWETDFKREKIGDMPTEMFYHFFKSFCDAAKCNLNIKAEGANEHHKIESIFKAFAKAIKMAIAVNDESDVLPTTKGVL
jgi:imidazoleglycerol-phosphate dehydratase/histidinol-phosphatase